MDLREAMARLIWLAQQPCSEIDARDRCAIRVVIECLRARGVKVPKLLPGTWWPSDEDEK